MIPPFPSWLVSLMTLSFLRSTPPSQQNERAYLLAKIKRQRTILVILSLCIFFLLIVMLYNCFWK